VEKPAPANYTIREAVEFFLAMRGGGVGNKKRGKLPSLTSTELTEQVDFISPSYGRYGIDLVL